VKLGTHKIFPYRVPDAYNVKLHDTEKPPDEKWSRIRRLLDRL
jgi:hypothetical protein